MSVAHATGAARLLSPLCASALMVVFASGYGIRSEAQTVPVTAVAAARPASSPGAEAEASELNLLVGRSAVVNVGQPIARVSLTSPDIADALVTTQQQLLVHGKTPGTISMFVWDRSGGIKRYEVIVQRDLSHLVEQIRQLFPGEAISVTGNGKDVVIAGTVSSKYVIEKAAEVASGYVANKDDVVNLLRQQEGIATNQVLLRVRFAEVNRSALTQLGINLFSDGYKDKLGSSTTQQYAAPFFDQRNPMVNKHLIFTDFLNLFFFDEKNQIGAVVKALQNKGLFQMLAEPNLIAENGKEASFLAGGEYPYPVAQGQSGNLSVTIVFKEFGVRLRFTPTVLGGDLINLKVAPEVSSLDFANAVVANGFRIPSLQSRRAETEVQLRDGQTFAIAGLLNNSVTSSLQKIPGIGDIPILGLLFRSKSAEKSRSELVVMITPQILRAGSTGAAPGLPNISEPFLGPLKKQLPPPPPWLGPTPQGGAMAVPAPPSSGPTNLRPRLAGDQPSQGAVASTTSERMQAERSSTTQAAPAGSAQSPMTVDASNPVPPWVAAESAPATRSSTASKADRKAAERAKEELKKQQEELKKQQRADAKQQQVDAERADQARKLSEQAAAEQARQDEARAKKEAEERAESGKKQAAQARKQAELAKKQRDADEKRGQAVALAEAKLKAAQAEYQAQLEQARREKTAETQPPDKQ